jgi:hypothetical protein
MTDPRSLCDTVYKIHSNSPTFLCSKRSPLDIFNRGAPRFDEDGEVGIITGHIDNCCERRETCLARDLRYRGYSNLI